MAKISNTSAYPIISSLNSKDYVVLTDASDSLLTKSCTIAQLKDFIDSGSFSLTTTGSSGASTLINGVLNIPVYTGGSGGVDSLNGLTGAVNITAGTGLSVTLVGNVINIGFSTLPITSLTTNGTSGASTLALGALNIPEYQGAITLVTSGSGAATLVGDTLTIPYSPLTLTTNGTGGAATLVGTTLNIPLYEEGLTVSTGLTSGPATLVGGTLSIPDYGSNAGSPLIAVFNLSVTAGVLTGSAFVNNFGGTWTFVKNGTGDYTATNSSAGLVAGYVMCIVDNPNVTVAPSGAGSGSYPESTVAERKSTTEIRIQNFDLSTTGVGTAKDFAGSTVWVEVRSYPI